MFDLHFYECKRNARDLAGRYLNRVEIVIFYTEILTRKVVLWCFFMSKTSEKNPQFNFSSENLNIEHNFFK